MSLEDSLHVIEHPKDARRLFEFTRAQLKTFVSKMVAEIHARDYFNKDELGAAKNYINTEARLYGVESSSHLNGIRKDELIKKIQALAALPETEEEQNETIHLGEDKIIEIMEIVSFLVKKNKDFKNDVFYKNKAYDVFFEKTLTFERVDERNNFSKSELQKDFEILKTISLNSNILLYDKINAISKEILSLEESENITLAPEQIENIRSLINELEVGKGELFVNNIKFETLKEKWKIPEHNETFEQFDSDEHSDILGEDGGSMEQSLSENETLENFIFDKKGLLKGLLEINKIGFSNATQLKWMSESVTALWKKYKENDQEQVTLSPEEKNTIKEYIKKISDSNLVLPMNNTLNEIANEIK